MTNTHVRYRGGAWGGSRAITADQWAEAGLDMPGVVWDEGNGWSVEIADWPEAAVNLIGTQKEFELVPNGSPVQVDPDLPDSPPADEAEPADTDDTPLSLGLHDLPQ